MPFLTRPHFEDRQLVQYGNESIRLSGITYISPTILDFTGTTSAETSVTINTLEGYLHGQRLSGLVVEPARLKLSGSTGTTTQNVTGFVLQSLDPYGSLEWAPISGVSWSISACTSPLYVSTIEACPNPTDPLYITAGNVQITGSIQIIDGTEQSGYVLTTDASGNATWQYNSTGFSGNTSATCITDLYITNLYGCSPITVHDSIIIATGKTITSSSGNGQLNLRDGGNNLVTLTNDGGAQNMSGIYLDVDEASIFTDAWDRALTMTSSVDIINLNSSEISRVINVGVGDSTQFEIRTMYNTNFSVSSGVDNKNAVFIASKTSTIGSGTTNSFIGGGTDNTINSNLTNVVILGGQNITGTTTDTVYVPNLTARGDHILHSDSTLEVVDLPSNYEDIIKGSYTSFNWTGLTTNIVSNNNPSGYSSIIIGNTSNYPINNPFGFISYFNSGYTRTSFSGSVGDDFYRDKLTLKAASGSNGMVINPKDGAADATLWFEINGRAGTKLKGYQTSTSFGIAMNPDGTEDADANLQIGGTGTTGTFKYIDGNEQNGYVLTSDANGNATWQSSSGTTGGITIDPYQDEGNVNSITWDVSGTSTNYEATLTGTTTLDLINVRNGDYGTLIVHQDGVGSRTLSFGTVNGGGGSHKVVNGGGGAPTLTATGAHTDILSFTYNGTAMYWTVGNDYS